VATIAVVQSVAGHRAGSGVVIVVFIALTYLVPRWRRSWRQQVEAAADGFVVEHGLGNRLGGVLGSPVDVAAMQARIDRIIGPTKRSALTLVQAR